MHTSSLNSLAALDFELSVKAAHSQMPSTVAGNMVQSSAILHSLTSECQRLHASVAQCAQAALTQRRCGLVSQAWPAGLASHAAIPCSAQAQHDTAPSPALSRDTVAYPVSHAAHLQSLPSQHHKLLTSRDSGNGCSRHHFKEQEPVRIRRLSACMCIYLRKHTAADMHKEPSVIAADVPMLHGPASRCLQ